MFDGVSVNISAILAVLPPVVPVLDESLDINRAVGGPCFQNIVGKFLERYVSVIQHAARRRVTQNDAKPNITGPKYW